MASINDVAKKAKVAKSTVSLVINNSGYVSEETRRKVEEAVRELNYEPSQLGRNLSNNRTDLIGVIIPDIAHPFYGVFVKYVEEALYRKGYKTVVCATVKRDNMEQEFLNMLNRRAMDGIIMGAHSLLHEQYMKLDKPVVAFDRDLGEQIPLICADHMTGGRIAAQTLLDNGCKNVVQISGARIVNTPAHNYHTVFEKVFREHGIEVEDVVMPYNTFEEEDFNEAAEKIFDTHSDVDGIFGADLAVMACMKEARRRGVHVPEQLKLIAYDGTAMTRQSERTIDAIVQPVEEIAYACAETIDRLVNNEGGVEKKQIFPVFYQKGETVCLTEAAHR